MLLTTCRRTGLAFLAGLGLLLACSVPTEDGGVPMNEAKGPSPSSGDPTVDGVDPSAAPQDTTLDIKVKGSNFDRGSQVRLLLNGEPTAGVVTNSTKFRNSSELIANITIAADAPVDAYDVEVTTSKGKKGIGLESFEVKLRPNQVLAEYTLGTSTGADGVYLDGSGSITRDLMGHLVVDCPRTFVLVRPSSWTIASGTEVHCSGSDGFSRLDLLDLSTLSCPDPDGCPIGTTGHDPSGAYGPDLNYYFRVKTGKGGKGAKFEEYNVVWVDARFTVDQTENGAAGAPPCRWRLWAATAEFWHGTSSRVGGNEPMALNVVLEKQGVTCP